MLQNMYTVTKNRKDVEKGHKKQDDIRAQEKKLAEKRRKGGSVPRRRNRVHTRTHWQSVMRTNVMRTESIRRRHLFRI
jgi:hypothetical protein